MNIINETIQYIEIGETWGIDKETLTFTILFTIVLITTLCFGIWGLIRWYRIEHNTWGMIGPGALMLVVVLMVISLWHSKPIYKEVPEYTIIINDTVTAKEFFDTYELQGIEGDTYIVRDKGWENND